MHRLIPAGVLAALILCLLLACCPASAEEARDLTGGCTFRASRYNGEFPHVTDGKLDTYFILLKESGTLEVRSAEPVWGVYVRLYYQYSKPVAYALEAEHNGTWVGVGSGGAYLSTWHPLEAPETHLRVRSTGPISMAIAEIRVYGPGDKPAEVQDWRTAEKCDLMLLTAHPDDELLWFGGLLPTYAGERGLTVQCVILVPTGGERRQEYLSVLWHCGVRVYPEFLNLPDNNGITPDKQYKRWYGRNHVLTKVVAAIRRYRPEVLVTHGEAGEYGHGAHRTAADAAKRSVDLAAQGSQFKSSASAYGPWQVKKLYLHEYGERPIVCDWDRPLSAFGGKTGFDVAEEAFGFHASQVKRGWAFERVGEHDNTAFGLYMSQVGDDTGIGDLMEHIEPAADAAE